jgi:hypothetical protein
MDWFIIMSPRPETGRVVRKGMGKPRGNSMNGNGVFKVCTQNPKPKTQNSRCARTEYIFVSLLADVTMW